MTADASGSAVTTVRAFVGLGSNLGDRLANLSRAATLLVTRDGVAGVAASRVYETEPLGPPQPDYLNAVIEVVTSVEPMELLQACLSVENEMGRVRVERWGPRLVDLDVLTFGDQVIDEPGLTVPHPRMVERAFVLVPLLELLPEATLPGGRPIATLRLEAAGSGQVRLFAPPMSMPTDRA